MCSSYTLVVVVGKVVVADREVKGVVMFVGGVVEELVGKLVEKVSPKILLRKLASVLVIISGSATKVVETSTSLVTSRAVIVERAIFNVVSAGQNFNISMLNLNHKMCYVEDFALTS